MVGLIVRLRWRVWSGLVRRNTALLVATIIGAVFALGLTLLAVGALVVLRATPIELRSGVVAAFALVTFGWTALSVLGGAAESTLDPSRFALFPVRPGELARGLLAATLTGVPPVLLTVAALSSVITWSQSLATAVAALVAAALGVLTTVLLARVVATGLGGIMRTRAGRAISAVAISVLALVPAMSGIYFGRPGAGVELTDIDAVRLAEAAGWTPVGWAWSLPLHVALGRPMRAVVAATLVLVLLTLLWWLYVRLIGRALTTSLTSVGGSRVRGRGLILRWAGLGPVGVIAARRLAMWRRDSRLVAIAVQSVIMPGILIGQAVVTDLQWTALFALVMLAVFAGLQVLNDLAFDGTAWALHIVTGAPGWQDRLGRVAAALVLFVPAMTILYAVLASLGLLTGGERWLACVLVALGASLGSASYVGSLFPGNAPPPGGSPFASTTGMGAEAALSGMAAFAIPMLVVVPVGVATFVLPDTGALTAALVVAGLLAGCSFVIAGVVAGGQRLDRRGPELLEQLRRAER